MPSCRDSTELLSEYDCKRGGSEIVGNQLLHEERGRHGTCATGCIFTKVKIKGRNTAYTNKNTCRQCQSRCASSNSHKTVSFGPDTDCVPVRMTATLKAPADS